MSDPSPTVHVPVLLSEVLHWLAPQPGQHFVDGTAGGGGHLQELARRVAPDGWVLGIDRDPSAIERLETSMKGRPVQLACGNYDEIPQFLASIESGPVDGILLDLGLSSDQLADPHRGFSFSIDGPLDLRFNPESGEPAWRLIQRLSVDHLADLIHTYGEERFRGRIARAIVEARRDHPIRTSRELAEVIERVIPRHLRDKIHPATRTFQALRIAVNDELESLRRALEKLPDCLKVDGRLAIISFHSLEDRLVKEAFQNDVRWERLTKKPVGPTAAEVACNPRSRSAKLRVARRRSN